MKPTHRFDVRISLDSAKEKIKLNLSETLLHHTDSLLSKSWSKSYRRCIVAKMVMENALHNLSTGYKYVIYSFACLIHALSFELNKLSSMFALELFIQVGLWLQCKVLFV